LVVSCLSDETMPPDDDDLAVAAALQISEHPITLPSEFTGNLRQRMLGDP
jgi:hypothetical protein